jgi:hypothetical protein
MAITSGVLDTYEPDLREKVAEEEEESCHMIIHLKHWKIHARARSRGIVSSIDL